MSLFIKTEEAKHVTLQGENIKTVTLNGDVIFKETPSILPPVIISQPNDTEVVWGDSDSVSVRVNKAPIYGKLTYQWFYQSGAPVSGATDEDLDTGTVPQGGHRVYAVITNEAGSVQSDSVDLLVMREIRIRPDDFEVQGIDYTGWQRTGDLGGTVSPDAFDVVDIELLASNTSLDYLELEFNFMSFAGRQIAFSLPDHGGIGKIYTFNQSGRFAVNKNSFDSFDTTLDSIIADTGVSSTILMAVVK